MTAGELDLFEALAVGMDAPVPCNVATACHQPARARLVLKDCGHVLTACHQHRYDTENRLAAAQAAVPDSSPTIRHTGCGVPNMSWTWLPL